jgi:CRP-like cAMP-binding protein
MCEYPSFQKTFSNMLIYPRMNWLNSVLTIVLKEKNKIILKQGEICEFEGYVLEGCFKVFYQDENGREHILYFAIEDWWVLDIDSLFQVRHRSYIFKHWKILLFSQSTELRRTVVL